MKKPHLLLTKSGASKKSFPKAFIGQVDGLKATSMKEFHEQIALAMEFPDYSGKNLDALDEMLNDLAWIKQETVVIYIKNSADWLSREKGDDRMLTILDIFDATAEDWKWMDEEEGVSKKELLVVFDDSPRIRTFLSEREIPFGEIE